MRFFSILAAMMMVFSAPTSALNVEEPLPDAALEAAAQQLFHEIRCVVCQGETIADSPAEVAGDLRRLVREKVAAGESGDAIKAYLVSRYGEVVLMHPPLSGATALLWFGPLLILLISATFILRYFRKSRPA